VTIGWNGVEFSDPVRIADWEPPMRAGVYAVSVPSGKPNVFNLIYVGESGNLSERGFYRQHHKFGCWMNKAGSLDNIFISIRLMPGSGPEERRGVEAQTIGTWQLDCQD
jgi:hypothetical protein